ncbi:DUF2304 domain-containing protein [Pseudarthrobacter oxydans]|jgi:hypothetical protein|uniref:DUF2304 domain-containing protein n=1 Tax=Pseudarthrobacter TaxID=1742993 RepID=UPI00203AE279|nr:DUF2304 domain-containing protein [Pseudarthrobacter sp. NCCP-2145]BFE45268.1 hypothetical protein GCM10017547_31610 [Pseudarthrobacter oxydans]GKV71695.1 hypothetical protein NCCP2145_10760 [Pseudarthrobacter sp. NCCP-2145]
MILPVLAAFILALVIVVLVVEMLRRKKLREKYAALWLVVGLATLVLAAFPQLLAQTARLLGVQVPSNLLFSMTILLALGVCLHLSWEISVVEDETRTLAEEAAILRTHIERLEARLDAELGGPSRNATANEPAPFDRG